jgi:hypothetical protein
MRARIARLREGQVAGAHGWELELDADLVLAAQGADPASVRRRSPALVETAERALRDGRLLLDPMVVQRVLPVERHGAEELILSGGVRLNGAAPIDKLRDAEEIVAAVCTIGPALEQRASASLADDPVYALALDGLGTAAVDSLTRAVCGQVAATAAARRYRATPPLSPGMMGWPLAEGQDQLFSLVDARAIGVVLTASRLMIPRKSVSMIIGIGPRVAAGGEPCAWCDMKETCRYRTRTDTRGA